MGQYLIKDMNQIVMFPNFPTHRVE